MASFQTLCTAKTLEAVEALRGTWTSLDIRDVDADIDGFVGLIQACEGNVRPHVVHLRRHDADETRDLLAVARVEQVSIPLKIGYRALCTFRVPALVTSFGGFLGVVDEADAQALVKELRRTIAGGDADLLILRSVETDGSLDRAVSASRLSHRQTTAQRWQAPLGGSLDAFLQRRSGKTRKRLRWEERVFRQTFGERLQMRRFDKPEHLDLICCDAESVASRTYQRGLGVSFRASPFERAMTAMALRQGWHRTWVLYLDERPIAFWSGHAYRGTFSVTTLGFDPDYAKHSIGRFTMFRMVEDLCADPSVAMLDLGPGDADYKMAFAEPAREERSVLLAAPRLRPFLLVAALSGLALVNRLGKVLLTNNSWGARCKKMWRSRLAGSRGSRPETNESTVSDEAAT